MVVVPKPSLQVPLVDLAAEYKMFEAEVNDAITGVLRKTDFILGRELALFESEFGSFCEAKHAVGVDSGLSALELILRAYGIESGDEVITPANTFIASALAISSVGATPKLVDADPNTYTIDVAALESAITRRTRAIMPVHLYGHPADMDSILEIAQKHGLPVIEDACQAHGARYRGNLGAYGDGGMVVTNDAKIAQYVEMARNYGQREKYYHAVRGYNHRLDTLHAAVLRIKLRRLDQRNAVRRDHARLYQHLLQNTGVVLPVITPEVEPVWHLFVIRVEQRDALRKSLADRGISAGIHYPIPIHLQEAYRDLGHKKGDFPVTEDCAERILSLPMYSELTEQMIEYVAEAVCEFTSEHKRLAAD
ncbi:MAG: erythromycin biosynthesis sensory transduction protein eryC1 [Acidobacteria bacterium]|nr:MAG: erythromycin biosynthesis sensory transduction protein eryC1 [Acidobacteriota bacterium]